MGVTERRKHRAFMKEFKAETVRLVAEGSRSIPEVARDLDLTESALRESPRPSRGTSAASRAEGDDRPAGYLAGRLGKERQAAEIAFRGQNIANRRQAENSAKDRHAADITECESVVVALEKVRAALVGVSADALH